MKFSVCTDAVFAGTNLVEAMKNVKSCGINAIEFWSWWDKDIERINAARREIDMTIAAMCTKFISLTNPLQRENYKESLAKTIQIALKLGCKRIITQVGDDTKLPREEQRQSIIEGLTQCAGMLEDAEITLVIEPLNTKIDHAGYYLWSSEEGVGIINEINSPCVKLLYDFYHQYIMGEDIIQSSAKMFDSIGHFHAAGYPGRHELDVGEIDYEAVFKALAEKDYKGFVGLEYFSSHDACEGLKKLMSIF